MEKYISAEQAVRVVKSGDRIFLHGSAATPHALRRGKSLLQRAHALLEIAHPDHRESLAESIHARFDRHT